MERQGLFIGLVTLDLVYRVEALPNPDQKMLAEDFTVAAGGPATNAAVTFGALGNRSTIVGQVGSHPAAQLIRADLAQQRVELIDIAEEQTAPPTLSSILIRKATGDRTVVYTAPKPTVSPDGSETVSTPPFPIHALNAFHIVLIDGHQMALSETVARQAKASRLPVVVDGGSWKPGFEGVLALTDYAICSADFLPPGCRSLEEVIAYLRSLQIPHIAITRGAKPVLYSSGGICGEVPVPSIQPVDTLGAGDIFHGAFCDAILRMEFREALAAAGAIAARSCLSFGTRAWINQQ